MSDLLWQNQAKDFHSFVQNMDKKRKETDYNAVFHTFYTNFAQFCAVDWFCLSFTIPLL